MKIQSVTLKRELWPAVECWRRRPVPPARAWQDIAMLKIPARLVFPSALKAWRDSKRLRLLSLWPADSLVARKDRDKEGGRRKKRTNGSRINNATCCDQDEKNVRKKSKDERSGRKLGDKSGRMSLLQLEYLSLEQQVWRMLNETSVRMCVSVSHDCFCKTRLHKFVVRTEFTAVITTITQQHNTGDTSGVWPSCCCCCRRLGNPRHGEFLTFYFPLRGNVSPAAHLKVKAEVAPLLLKWESTFSISIISIKTRFSIFCTWIILEWIQRRFSVMTNSNSEVRETTLV